MELKHSKAEFATVLLTEPNPFKAAMIMTKGDTDSSLWYAVNWQDDHEVIELLKKLREDQNNITKIATKFDVAQLYWNIANSRAYDAKDRIAAAEKYASIAGLHDTKTSSGGNVNVNVNQNMPRVMVVKDHGTDEEWERKVAAQQAELQKGNYVPK